VPFAAPPTLDRAAYAMVLEDDFDAPALDEGRWLPHYLPHWSTADRTAARYKIRDGVLRLLIEAGQPPWCPELDADLRVSSLQTGVFAGPVGSRVGQLQFHPEVAVRSPQRNRALLTVHHGLIETRMRALDDPRVMVALWMIGFEDAPERSSEICVAEIFGRDVRSDRAKIGMGVHPWADPAITDDFIAEEVAIDVRDWHTYSADWTPDGIAWYVDDRLVRTVDQSASYPMQLMLGIYEFPIADDPRRPADYPKAFEVDWVRVSRRSLA
jgi:glycosyl hydrolase family 16